MKGKRISVCMATYNGEKYVEEQVKSILSEITDEDELLISDDSSTDNTIAIIERIADKRITIFKGQSFRNHIKNFQFCLSKANGEYIFMSDQDDVWVQGKVNKMMEQLKNHDMVLHNAMLTDGAGKIFREKVFPDDHNLLGFVNNFKRNNYIGCCMAFKKKVLKYALPFPDKINSHDMWLGLVGELLFSTAAVREPLIRFRRHGSNFSAHENTGDTFITAKSPYSLTQIIAQRAYMLRHLMARKMKKIF